MLASTITATGAGHSQNAAGQLQSLVETSARRLVIAKQVALAKWDDGTAVEDAPREAKVIAGAVKDGESVGLEPASVANFFRAQIEANKVVQYSLLADWRRSGKCARPHTNQFSRNHPAAIGSGANKTDRRIEGHCGRSREHNMPC